MATLICLPLQEATSSLKCAAFATTNKNQFAIPWQLTNHLGNILTVLSDKKTGKPKTGDPSMIGIYEFDMLTAADYTPFGMIMPGRNYSFLARYRYGFNGKEYDNEVQAAGNLLDYGNRMYDPLAGRFWGVDPMTRDYAFLTPYQYASNRPIDGIDLDGLEFIKPIPKWEKSGGAFDYVTAVNNGVINLLNLPITTWNSAVKNVQELGKGTWKETVSGELQQMGQGVSSLATQFTNAPLTTLTSPDAVEFYTEAFIGAKAFNIAPKTGNLLKIERGESTASKNIIQAEATTESNIVLAARYAKNRPTFRKGVVEQVWEKAVKKSRDGIVRDPNTNEVLSWNKAETRRGQWDMGHTKGNKYSDLVEKLRQGRINKEQFLDEYNNPKNYRPEKPLENQGHKHE
ncbi:MAG: GH-E family nuclease [Chitinophagaceae bacterium]|nr:GH-E family nuclease [Chitinophagaceae bacterium]